MSTAAGWADEDRVTTFVRFADAALDVAEAATRIDPRAVNELAHTRAELHSPRAVDTFDVIADNAWADGPARELLAVLLACELDVTRGARANALVGARKGGRLTLGAAAGLLGVDACAEAAGPGSSLRRAALLDTEGTGPWAATTLAVPPEVVWAVVGDQTPSLDLPLGASVHHVPADNPSPLPTRGHDLVVHVSGSDRVRRRALAMRRCRGERFLVTPEPDTASGWAALVRQATISGCTVVVELSGSTLPADGRRWIERATHLRWALTSVEELALSELPDRDRVEYVAVGGPAGDDEWDDAFSGEVAHSHQLTPAQLELVVPTYLAVDGDLDRAVRRLLSGPLGTSTRRVRPTRSWSDLVLDPAKLAQLRMIVSRYRYAATVLDDWGLAANSGRGTVAMFSGQSGTGKTMAAEVIAAELHLDLFKVDLSAVVSKYIGETEQNLEKVFSTAAAGNSVLFFDEADSLFGKRAEVKDARDRYANLEVSYLLQRLESYEGIVVLATNLPQNLDDAFLRRIHVMVDFPVPGVSQRKVIWQRHLPVTVPQDRLDFDLLAERFELTGGVIRNVATAAAFRAADDATDECGPAVTMRHVMAALTTEYVKQRRIIREEDFDDRASESPAAGR